MDGTPKLLDFGIAKLLNADVAGHTHAPTVAGMQLMTPEYASPEQVRGDPVTTATDVYSLGVLLYELLTGRRPYRITSRAPIDVARVVCEAVPARPSTAVTNPSDGPDAPEPITGAEAVPTREVTAGQLRAVEAQRLSRRLAGDLDTIVLKALSKEPARRYASVDQFSEDVRRHLEGLPVLARRDTCDYRAAKFIRRHRAAVGAAALTFLALVAGVIGTAWQAREARIARARAEARFDDVRRLANAFVFDMHDAIRDLPGSTPARRLLVSKALEYLDRLAREAGGRRDLQSELASAIRADRGRPGTSATCRTWATLRARSRAIARRPPSTSRSARRRRPTIAAPGSRTAYLRLSEVLSSAGQTADALAITRTGLALHEATTDDTSPADARRALVASNSRMGDLLSATGDTAGALVQRRKVLAMMEAVAARSRTTPTTCGS